MWVQVYEEDFDHSGDCNCMDCFRATQEGLYEQIQRDRERAEELRERRDELRRQQNIETNFMVVGFTRDEDHEGTRYRAETASQAGEMVARLLESGHAWVHVDHLALLERSE